MVGDFSVGKTSLTQKFVKNIFSEQYLSTVGVKIDTKELDELKLIIWDMAGRDSLSPININYLVGAAGVIYVADGTRKETIEVLASMRSIVEQKIGQVASVVAINKFDDQQNWQTNEASVISSIGENTAYFNTSAKSGLNVENLFACLSEMLAK
jgi:small GTP-binding protein